MTSIHEILNKSPGDFFLAVVELEGCSVIGIIDDPVGVALSEVRIHYPLEFLVRVREADPADADIGFIVPEIGLPDETIIDAGTVDIHMGNSPFGLSYFTAVKSLIRGPVMNYHPKIIKRPLMGGTQNGTRERHKSL